MGDGVIHGSVISVRELVCLACCREAQMRSFMSLLNTSSLQSSGPLDGNHSAQLEWMTWVQWIVDLLKHLGTTDCVRDRLKIVVSTGDSQSAQVAESFSGPQCVIGISAFSTSRMDLPVSDWERP